MQITALEREKWQKRNSYYHRLVINFYRYHIPENSSVLEVGCANGLLLNALSPSRGVGIDVNSDMIKTAKEKYPHLKFINADIHNVELQEKFDFIIISDTLGYLEDIQLVFKHLRNFCHDGTRIIITFYNFLWEPLLKLGEFCHLKMKEQLLSWLSIADVANLLYLEDYDVLKKGRKILFPKNIPLISYLINRFAANLPGIEKLNMMNFVIARPVKLHPHEHKSVSIVVPARNEAGNIAEIIKRIPVFTSDIEVIFVEGNSTDNTYETIRNEIASYSGPLKLKSVRQDGEGKGDAVRKGFDMAKGDIFMILDADMTVQPEDLPKFYDVIYRNKGEFINGCRLVYPLEQGSMRFLNILGNKVFGMIFSYLLDQRFKDTLCGTKVLSKKNYEKIKANRDYFGDFDPFGDFDLIFGASKQNLKIVELPIRYKRRVYGDTNIRRFYHALLLFRMCIFAMRKIKFI